MSQAQAMPRFPVNNLAKMFEDNSSYRGARRREKPEYRISNPATLAGNNQLPEIVKVWNIGTSGQ